VTEVEVEARGWKLKEGVARQRVLVGPAVVLVSYFPTLLQLNQLIDLVRTRGHEPSVDPRLDYCLLFSGYGDEAADAPSLAT
jgi:hypothetical protein